MEELLQHINSGLSQPELFGSREANEICQAMSEQEEIFVIDGVVHRI